MLSILDRIQYAILLLFDGLLVEFDLVLGMEALQPLCQTFQSVELCLFVSGGMLQQLVFSAVEPTLGTG